MRYTGPVWKKSRRLGYSVLESGKELRKRSYAPGQHGNEKKKLSEYGKQLAEKQKLRETYGVNERQFRRLYVIATKSNEVTGLAFMRLLESRLDNLVYRLGFASTRRQARQLVNHGHVLVNGKKIDIPSYLVNVNDVISLKESASLNSRTRSPCKKLTCGVLKHCKVISVGVNDCARLKLICTSSSIGAIDILFFSYIYRKYIIFIIFKGNRYVKTSHTLDYFDSA